MCLKTFQIKERHMTLENVTAGVVDAQGNKVNHPHTLILSKAKICKRHSWTVRGIRINLKKTGRIFQPNSHPPTVNQGGYGKE